MNLSGRGSTDAAISFINALSEGVKQRRIYQFDIAQQNLRRKQAREDAQLRFIDELRLQTAENMVEAGVDSGIGSGIQGVPYGFEGEPLYRDRNGVRYQGTRYDYNDQGGVPGAVAPGAAAPGVAAPGAVRNRIIKLEEEIDKSNKYIASMRGLWVIPAVSQAIREEELKVEGLVEELAQINVAPGAAAPGAVIPGLENLGGGIGSQQPTMQPTTPPTTPPTIQDQFIQAYQKHFESLRMKKVAGDKKEVEEQIREQISGIVGPILKKHPELAKMYFDAGGVKFFAANPKELGPLLTYLSNYDQAKDLETAKDEAKIELEKKIAAEGRQITGARKASVHEVFMEYVEEYPDLSRYVDDDGNIPNPEALIEHYKVLEGQIETVPLSFFGTPGSPSEGHYQDEIQTKAMDRVNNEWARITLRMKDWNDDDYNKFTHGLFEDVSKLIVNSVRSAVGDAIQKAKVEGTITQAQRTVLLREQKNTDNVHIKNIIRRLKTVYGRILAQNESLADPVNDFWDLF